MKSSNRNILNLAAILATISAGSIIAMQPQESDAMNDAMQKKLIKETPLTGNSALDAMKALYGRPEWIDFDHVKRLIAKIPARNINFVDHMVGGTLLDEAIKFHNHSNDPRYLEIIDILKKKGAKTEAETSK